MPPDLAIEALGPFRTVAWALQHAALYLEAGVRLLWIVDPDEEAVAVIRPDRLPVLLREGDVLNGGDVLPGFAVPVGEIFR